MERVYNFAAGPSAMPEAALKKAAAEMLCYGDTGVSVMEMSHRAKMYLEIWDEAGAFRKATLCCFFRAVRPDSSRRCP